MNPEARQTLINLGLATAGGAGAGSLLEYLKRGRVSWVGPTGGALVAGGGYLALSPSARRALLGLAETSKKKRIKKKETPLSVSAKNKLFTYINEYTARHGVPPKASQLKKEIPSLGDNVANSLAVLLDRSNNASRDHKYSAPGSPTNAANFSLEGANTALALSALGKMVFSLPALAGTPVAAAGTGASAAMASKVAPPLMLAHQLWDTQKALFYNPETEKWNTDVGGNMRSNQETLIRNLKGNDRSLLTQMAVAPSEGLVSPIRSILAAGGTAHDTLASLQSGTLTGLKYKANQLRAELAGRVKPLGPNIH